MEINNSALELLSRAALNVQEHDAIELSKLPAKKRLTQLKAQQQLQLQQQQLQQQQQNAILNSVPPSQSSISIIPINQPHSAASTISINNNNNNSIKTTTTSLSSDRVEPMDQDDPEINVDGDDGDDDSPLDMRITSKHDSDNDSVRPSVIRRAPSFKETNSNSPSDPSSTCDPFIDEHFRRSLGTDYDLIMRNKQLEQEQKQRILDEQLILQQQAVAAAAALHAHQQPQQNILKLKHHKKTQIHQHHQAMLGINQDNQLPIPIQVPVSVVPSTLAHSVPQTALPSAVKPVSVPPMQAKQEQPQKHFIITEHSDANDPMSVDDHFAKALGDTWKKIQNESK